LVDVDAVKAANLKYVDGVNFRVELLSKIVGLMGVEVWNYTANRMVIFLIIRTVERTFDRYFRNWW
jgi:hypothetical protein